MKKPLDWYVKKHREMWDWLAKNPGRRKRDWPGWNRFKREYWASCFACQCLYDYDVVDVPSDLCSRLMCHEEGCLFDWGKHDTCMDVDSLYNQWGLCLLTPEQVKLAEQIRDLKVNHLFVERYG